MNIELMKQKANRMFQRETAKSFKRWLHKNREDQAYENKKKGKYRGELIEAKEELEGNILSLIDDFNRRFPGLFIHVDCSVITSSNSFHYENSVRVETSVNETGKPIKF